MSIYEEAFEVWGMDAQIAALAEEAAELAAACCRALNGKCLPGDLAEEIIGVQSVAASLRPHLLLPEQWAEVEADQMGRLLAGLDKARRKKAGLQNKVEVEQGG